MACGCKQKQVGQPTAIKQVAKNRNFAVKNTVSKTPQEQRAAKETVVRRVVKRPIF